MNKPWGCTKCSAVVFIPAEGTPVITGGVCTQQRRGCAGELRQLTEHEAAQVRALLGDVPELPWLTLLDVSPPPRSPWSNEELREAVRRMQCPCCSATLVEYQAAKPGEPQADVRTFYCTGHRATGFSLSVLRGVLEDLAEGDA